jgi:probable F420-dependent oxidoreductase
MGYIRRLAELIEDLGYGGVFLADSLGSTGEPLIPLAAFASYSTRIRVGTCVYVLPLRQPFMVAKQVSSLQRLSDNRFILGVGVGWRKWEFDSVGVDYASRGERMDEELDILRLAWKGDPVSYSGKHFKFGDTDLGAELDTPPPIWVGGNSVGAIRRAAKYGDAWIPTDFSPQDYRHKVPLLVDGLRRLGRSQDQFELCSHLALIMDSDNAKARSAAAEVAGRIGERPEEFVEYALVGDPPHVAERITEYIALGVKHHVLSMFFTETSDTLLDKLRLFSTQVVPSL